MDFETRTLLYLVLFGAGTTLGVLILRRIGELLVLACALTAIFGAAVATFAVGDGLAHLVRPLAVAYVGVGILPALLVHGGRRLAQSRRHRGAAASLFAGGLLMGLPRPLRREAAIHASLADLDAGRPSRARERLLSLRRIERDGDPERVADLAAILPEMSAGRWEAALAAIGAASRRTVSVAVAEARAAAEVGDVRRALRVADELAARLSPGSAPVASAQRAVLAAAGRHEFLAAARARGLAVADDGDGAFRASMARALEAAGETERARREWEAAERGSRGTLRTLAAAGRARCGSGAPRLARLDEIERAAVHDLERACEAVPADPSRRSLVRRAPFTAAGCALATAVSAAVFLLLGNDVFSLVAAGAIGRELCMEEGAWWRLGTAMLLHGGWLHLALNVGSALVVGAVYEQRAGSVRTAIVALGAGFLASLASVLTGTPIGVGASGAVMGLVGGLLALLVLDRHLFAAAERRQWLSMIALTVVANALIGLAEPDGVDNAAHAGGLAAGFAIAAAVRPRRVETEVTRGVRRLAAGVLIGLLVGGIAEAALGLPKWLGWKTAHVEGARAELPTWLRRDDAEEGFLARTPLTFAMQLGRRDRDQPNPPALLRRLAAGGLDVSPAWTAGDVSRRAEGDFEVEELLFVPPPDESAADLPPVRVVTIFRKDAFATVVLPASDEGERAFGGVLRSLARTLESVTPRFRSGGGSVR